MRRPRVRVDSRESGRCASRPALPARAVKPAAAARRWRCPARSLKYGAARSLASVRGLCAARSAVVHARCCRSIASSSAATARLSSRRGAGGARAGLRGREHSSERSRRVAAPAARVALGEATRRCGASLPSTIEVVVRSGSRSASAAFDGRLYLVDERGVDHRRVRSAHAPISICRSSTACRRAPARRERADDGRARRAGGAADRRRSGRSRSIARPPVAGRRQRSAQRVA